MSFPKYPDYKPSRLDTRAPLPSSWSEAPIKRAFDIVSGSTPKTDNEEFWDGETTWVTPADLSGLDAVDVTESKRTITEAGLLSCGTTLVPAGSIVISTRAPIGTLAIAGKELCTNQGCKALVPNGECSSRFAYYYLSACTEQLNINGRGTTFLELSGDELGSFLMPKPAPVEQELICAFLDRETAKIDTLIAEQQRLIELLQEKRQAVISHAVTKGLNPNAPMKDSGVEWLGQVPEHWTAQKASWLFRAEKGKKAQELTQEYCGANEGPFPVFSGQTKDGGVMGAIDSYEFDVGETGAILCTTVGAKAMSIRLITGQFSLSQNCMVITSKTAQVTPAFFEYGLQPLFKHERALIPDHMQPSFRMEDFNQFWVQVPPIDEQARIAKYLQEENQASSELATAISGGIGLLQERRSALISAAVTGQIDVRGFVEVEGSEL